MPSARQRAVAPKALTFVVMVGIMSFFADFTYEGSRSITGPYLGLLGAGAFTVSVVSGAGEFIGYNVRLLSGPGADRTGRYWPVTIGGYIVQMSAVPLLALAGSWQVAALLIIAERIGKGIRNPPRDAMLSHAAKEIGYGRAFGLHEALDQFGAMFGPLLVALVLTVSHQDYKAAFAALAIPAAVMLSLLAVARLLYPRPRDLSASSAEPATSRFPRVFWVYLAAAALAGAGFADFPLIAYHFQHAGTVSVDLTPVCYAVAMAVSGTGSLVLGRVFDRAGIGVLVPLTIVSAAYAPLVFLGGFWAVMAGSALWGLGMGVQESLIPAAVAPMVSADRRAYAYGLFTAAYGTAWVLGSVVIGVLVDVSAGGLVAFCIAAELAAIPLILAVRRQTRARLRAARRSARRSPAAIARRRRGNPSPFDALPGAFGDLSSDRVRRRGSP